MNIYDIKLEGDMVTLAFNDGSVKTYKEIETPVAPVEEAPATPEVASVETPAEIPAETPEVSTESEAEEASQ